MRYYVLIEVCVRWSVLFIIYLAFQYRPSCVASAVLELALQPGWSLQASRRGRSLLGLKVHATAKPSLDSWSLHCPERLGQSEWLAQS